MEKDNQATVLIRVTPTENKLNQLISDSLKRKKKNLSNDFSSLTSPVSYYPIESNVTIAEDKKSLSLRSDKARRERERILRYDHIFDEDATQDQIYQHISSKLCFPLLGVDLSILTYGAVKTGKTYSMVGEKESAEKEGIIPTAVKDIFSQIDRITNSRIPTSYHVEMSYVELYNNNFRNLLGEKSGFNEKTRNRRATVGSVSEGGQAGDSRDSPTANEKIDIHDSEEFGVFLSSNSSNFKLEVTSPVEALDLFDAGKKRRTVQVLDRSGYSSSRGHAILTLHFECRSFIPTEEEDESEIMEKHEKSPHFQLPPKGKTSLKFSKLNFVDMAGVGRFSADAKEKTINESHHINLSLTSLGDCLHALVKNTTTAKPTPTKPTKTTAEPTPGTPSSITKPKHLHVPYLNSKLSHLLKDCLMGSGQLVFIATIQPDAKFDLQTLTTLKYATWAHHMQRTAEVKQRQLDLREGGKADVDPQVARLRRVLLVRSKRFEKSQLESLTPDTPRTWDNSINVSADLSVSDLVHELNSENRKTGAHTLKRVSDDATPERRITKSIGGIMLGNSPFSGEVGFSPGEEEKGVQGTEKDEWRIRESDELFRSIGVGTEEGVLWVKKDEVEEMKNGFLASMSEMERENTELKNNLKNLKLKESDNKNRINDLESELKTINDEKNEDLYRFCEMENSFEDEKSGLLSSVNEKDREIEELRGKLKFIQEIKESSEAASEYETKALKSKSEKEKNDLHEEIKKLKELLEGLKTKENVMEQKIHELQKSLENQKKQYHDEINDLNSQFTINKTKLKEEVKKSENLSKELEFLQSVWIEKFDQISSNLTKKQLEYDDIIKDLNAKLEIEKNMRFNEENKNEDLITENGFLSHEREKLESLLQSARNDKTAKEVELQRENDELRRRNDELTNELSVRESIWGEKFDKIYGTVLEKQVESDDEYEKVKSELNTKIKELQEIEERRIIEYNRSFKSSGTDPDERFQYKLTTEFENMKSELSENLKKLEEMSGREGKQRDEMIKSLKTELEAEKEKVKTLELNLITQQKIKEKESNHLKDEIFKINSLYESEKTENTKITGKNDDLSKSLNEKEIEIMKLVAELKQTRNSIMEQDEDQENITKLKMQKNSEITKLKTELEKQRNLFTEKDENHDKSTKLLAQKDKEIMKLTAELERTRNLLTKNQENTKNTIAQKDTEIMKLTTELDKQRDLFTQKDEKNEEEIKKLHEKTEKLKLELKEKSISLETEVKKSYEYQKSLETEVQKLSKELEITIYKSENSQIASRNSENSISTSTQTPDFLRENSNESFLESELDGILASVRDGRKNTIDHQQSDDNVNVFMKPKQGFSTPPRTYKVDFYDQNSSVSSSENSIMSSSDAVTPVMFLSLEDDEFDSPKQFSKERSKVNFLTECAESMTEVSPTNDNLVEKMERLEKRIKISGKCTDKVLIPSVGPFFMGRDFSTALALTSYSKSENEETGKPFCKEFCYSVEKNENENKHDVKLLSINSFSPKTNEKQYSILNSTLHGLFISLNITGTMVLMGSGNVDNWSEILVNLVKEPLMKNQLWYLVPTTVAVALISPHMMKIKK